MTAVWPDVPRTTVSPELLAEFNAGTARAVEDNRRRERREAIKDGAVQAWGGEGR